MLERMYGAGFGGFVLCLPIGAAALGCCGCEDAAEPAAVLTSGSEPMSDAAAPSSSAGGLERSSSRSSTSVAVASSAAAVNVATSEGADASRFDAGSANAPALDAATDGGTWSLERLRTAYGSWPQYTAEPVNISARIFALCRSPNAAESGFVESVHGDGLYLLDWFNTAAYAAARGHRRVGDATLPDGVAFPVGAAIVKEKLVRNDAGGYHLAALGLMVKREPGFDSATGDWEFGYWEPAGGLLSGATENAACGPCHAAATSDFVFLDDSWRDGVP